MPLRNEYFATENRIPRNQIKGQLRLTDGEIISPAEIGKKLAQKALEEVACIVNPDTIRGGNKRLISKKFDGSSKGKYCGRAKIDDDIENLIVKFAKENRSWGYDRIAGALKDLGHEVSDQTVGNILKRDGLPSVPKRLRGMTWKDFIRSHMDVLAATDFCMAEVSTCDGLVTY